MESVISRNDKQVLQMIISPNLPLTGDEDTIASAEHDNNVDSTFDQIKLTEVKRLEKEGVTFAEMSKPDEALQCFDQAVAILPNRASVYNNRAQVKRITGNVEGALQDLDKAIAVSDGEGRVASLAFTQRGLLMKLQGNKTAAESDFSKAAKLGNKFAQQELVQSNPYAALCNQMLGKVIKQLQAGESDQL